MRDRLFYYLSMFFYLGTCRSLSMPLSLVHPVPLFNKYGYATPGMTLVIVPDQSPLYTLPPVDDVASTLVHTFVPTLYFALLDVVVGLAAVVG